MTHWPRTNGLEPEPCVFPTPNPWINVTRSLPLFLCHSSSIQFGLTHKAKLSNYKNKVIDFLCSRGFPPKIHFFSQRLKKKKALAPISSTKQPPPKQPICITRTKMQHMTSIHHHTKFHSTLHFYFRIHKNRKQKKWTINNLLQDFLTLILSTFMKSYKKKKKKKEAVLEWLTNASADRLKVEKWRETIGVSVGKYL